MFNTWKPMWVVLSEDGIEFFKKKTDNNPKGMIPLKGSTLTSPCQDFAKRTFVFKLTTTKQQDHIFQASHLEERDGWVKDIKKAIKCILGGQRFSRKSTKKSIRLPETINLSALYLSMKDPNKGIREMKLEKEKKIFNYCFTGSSVIDWLLSNNSLRNRQEGIVLASALLNEGYFQAADDTSKIGLQGLSETPFLDMEDAYYYFVDSGFFCEGNSSDDDTIFKEEFRGMVIKQGCLLKQGHRRKNWKVRKFVLREDPAYMHYYDPAAARKMKWRETSLRSLPQVKCTTSFKQPLLQNVQNGSRPFSLSLELENESLLVLAKKKKKKEKSSEAIYPFSSSL
ncbi:hypothetical protein E2320_019725 [Naja naja]|nr:hypothetical protein E2320_019725 [Naja naja]